MRHVVQVVRRTRTSGSRTPTLLMHRDFGRLFLAQCVSVPGTYAAHVGLAVYAWQATQSPGWVAAVTFGRLAPALIVSPYAGVVAERVERVRLLVVSDLLMAWWQLALVLLVAGRGPIVLAVGLAALNSVTGSAYRPATTALTPQLVGERHLPAAASLNAALQSVVLVVGPALGALVIVLSSPAWVFGVNATTFVVSALLLATLRVRSRASDVTSGGCDGVTAQLRVGIRALAGGGPMALTSANALGSLVYGADTVLLVLMSEQWLGTGPAGYGHLLCGLGVGGLLTAAVASRAARRPATAAVLIGGTALYTLPALVLLLAPLPSVALAVAALRGAGLVVVEVVTVVSLQRALAPRVISRAFGVFFGLGLLAKSVGALVSAPLVGLLGLHGTVALVAVTPPVVLLAAIPALRGVDRGRVTDTAALPPQLTLLGGTALLAHAAPATLGRLATAAGERTLAAGQVLMAAGQPADALYILVEGRLAVHAPDGAPLPSMSPTDVVGEIGCLTGLPRTATVSAAGPARVLRLAVDDVMDALSVVPPAPALLGRAASRLARTHPDHPALRRNVPGLPHGLVVGVP